VTRDSLFVESVGEQPRITVWWCDECSYWRQDKSTGIHMAQNPDDWRGRHVEHALRPVVFEMVEPQ